MVQRSRQEAPGESGEQPADGEDEERAGRRRDELAPCAGRCPQPLRTIRGPGIGRLTALGRAGDEHDRPEQRDEQKHVRERQAVGRVLREHAGDQRSDRQTADVGDRGDDARPAARRAVGPGVQVGDVGRGGGDARAERDAGEHARHEQAGERLPGEEDDRRDGREEEPRDQHGAPAVRVGHVAGEQEARDDADRVDGVDDGERQRRQALLLGVEPVEGARRGGERAEDEEGERDRPEAGGARQSRESCVCGDM